MSRLVEYNFIASSATYICSAQTLAGAGSFVIDGAGWDQNSVIPRVQLFKTSTGFARPVTLTSAGNISGVNFTITGKDLRGNILTETLAGPNANTVSSVNNFYEINTITTNAAVGTGTSVGIGSTGVSSWIPLDYLLTPIQATIQCSVSGTINYTVQETISSIQVAEPASSEVFSDATNGIVNGATSLQCSIMSPVQAVRFLINSSSAGTLAAKVLQAGVV